MARKTFKTVPYRRRREEKTNYKKRISLIKSNQPRLVIRRSLNNLIVQIIEFDPKGDRILIEAQAKNLAEFGWKSLTGNIPSSYLTGYLAGIKAKKAKLKADPIFDLGPQTSTKGSRIYAAVKGFIDSGYELNAKDTIFPDQARIKGTHIENYAKHLKETDPSLYEKRFSSYLKNKIDPTSLSKQFETSKQKIGELK